jgi:uncharacterized protein
MGKSLLKIVLYRSENGPFENRAAEKSTSFGRKSVSTVAFIRISNAKNPLDNSAVYPELMELSKKWPILTVK